MQSAAACYLPSLAREDLMELDKAVLLHRMQQPSTRRPAARWNAAVDDNGRALLAAWRGAGRPVIHVRTTPWGGLHLAPGQLETPCAQGSSAQRRGAGHRASTPLSSAPTGLRLRRRGWRPSSLSAFHDCACPPPCASAPTWATADPRRRRLRLLRPARRPGGDHPAENVHRVHLATWLRVRRVTTTAGCWTR